MNNEDKIWLDKNFPPCMTDLDEEGYWQDIPEDMNNETFFN